MAWALVQHAKNGNADGATGPFRAPHSGTINAVGADLYLVPIAFYGSDPPASVLTDVSGNTYTLLTPIAAIGDGNCKIAWFYKVAPATSAVEAWTITPSGGGPEPQFVGMVVLCFSGCAAVPTITHTESGATTSTPSAGSLGAAGNLVVTAVADYTALVSSIDSGFDFAGLSSDYTGSNNIGIAAAWQNLSGGVAGAVNPTWTLTGSPSAVVVQALSITGTGGVGTFIARPGLNIRQAVNRAGTY